MTKTENMLLYFVNYFKMPVVNTVIAIFCMTVLELFKMSEWMEPERQIDELKAWILSGWEVQAYLQNRSAIWKFKKI